MPYSITETIEQPIMKVTFTGERANDENFTDYLSQLKGLYDFKKPIVILFDASKASYIDLKYQKMQAKWLDENKSLMKKYCLGTAYIIKNSMIRAALKLIFAIQKQPVPYKIFSDTESARDWGLQLLSQRS